VSGVGEESKAKDNALALDKLTSLANKFIEMGYYDIYEDTYEKITLKLSVETGRKESSTQSQFDIFADDVDANVLGKKTESIVDSVVKGKFIFSHEVASKLRVKQLFTSQFFEIKT
jgi:hypothetical protein